MLAGLSQFTELPAVYTYYINTSMQNPNVFGLFLYIGHSNRFTAFLIWNRAGKEEEWGKKNKLVCKTALPWSNRQTSHLAQHWHKTAQLTVWGDLNTEFQVSASISPTRSFPCPRCRSTSMQSTNILWWVVLLLIPHLRWAITLDVSFCFSTLSF